MARLLSPRASEERHWGALDALAAWALLFLTGAGVFRFTKVVVGNGDNWPIVWPWSVPAYAAVCLVVVAGLWVFAMSDTRLRLPGWICSLLTLVALGLLFRFYVLFEPRYAPGSDNADALEVGVRALVNGHFPYHFVSKLGGPLSPMLGGFLLALPIMAAGVTLYAQMPLWLAAGSAAVHRVTGPGAALAAVALTCTSVMMREALPRQSDNWVCALAVVLFGTWGWLLARGAGSDHRGQWGWPPLVLQGLWTVAFACALAYRFHLWVAVVPLIVLWVRTLGWRSMWRWMMPAGVVTLALVFAPLLVDAKAYLGGPFAMGAAKTGGAGQSLLVGVATLVVLAITSLRVRTLPDVWASLAWSMAAMVVAVGLGRLPMGGFAAAFSAYVTVAFNGAIFIPGLAALLLPRLGAPDPRNNVTA